ncbi:MAG: hypothetical protein AAF939_01040 [Planctomycetota bacterium]
MTDELPPARNQFAIKALLWLTLVICLGLRFFTLDGSFAIRLMITILFSTFLAAAGALFWYVGLPLIDKNNDLT